MDKIFIFIICILLCFSCKKEAPAPVLHEIQFRIVNNGDSLVSGFVLWTTTLLSDGRTLIFHDQAFNNIRPFDTVTIHVTGLQENSRNFLDAIRLFRLRVALKRKIFSELHFNNNYIEGGDPNLYGWTQTLNFIKETPDTIKGMDDKIFYINWPADSAKLKQVIFF